MGILIVLYMHMNVNSINLWEELYKNYITYRWSLWDHVSTHVYWAIRTMRA